ncbi:hypothetical protein BB560_006342 [Smittium megazygosporum]|uniref:EF-hand domain-containing protein n=1 Tax=Smittium megazygosporum TaxID=133381 RepID=A0A2T9Y8U6_9FUNG|nr:hypothetical protein BB560_006342 [Smittium megazygosporum]
MLDKELVLKAQLEDLKLEEEKLQKSIEYTFKTIDVSKDGDIGADDLKKLYQRFGKDIPQESLETIVRSLGTSSGISQAEFDSLVKPDGIYDKEDQFKRTFAMFDLDGDKLLSAEDLSNILSTFGEPVPMNEVEEMIHEADVDGDGKINYEEFVKMLETM